LTDIIRRHLSLSIFNIVDYQGGATNGSNARSSSPSSADQQVSFHQPMKKPEQVEGMIIEPASGTEAFNRKVRVCRQRRLQVKKPDRYFFFKKKKFLV
jgi:hypothetical protein